MAGQIGDCFGSHRRRQVLEHLDARDEVVVVARELVGHRRDGAVGAELGGDLRDRVLGHVDPPRFDPTRAKRPDEKTDRTSGVQDGRW